MEDGRIFCLKRRAGVDIVRFRESRMWLLELESSCLMFFNIAYACRKFSSDGTVTPSRILVW